MTWETNAEKGDLLGTMRWGVVTGALYAVGTAWAVALQSITRELAIGTKYMWLAELGAALLTTGIGTAVAVTVARRPPTPAPTPARVVSRPGR
jgi:hypothetical protein